MHKISNVLENRWIKTHLVREIKKTNKTGYINKDGANFIVPNVKIVWGTLLQSVASHKKHCKDTKAVYY